MKLTLRTTWTILLPLTCALLTLQLRAQSTVGPSATLTNWDEVGRP